MAELWALTKRYVFDVCIVLGAGGAVLEMALTQDDPEAPSGTLWVMCLLVALIPLPLLFRRWFPFGAPAGVFAVAVVGSFVNGGAVSWTFSTFLAVLAASFLFGMLADQRQGLGGLAIAAGAAIIVVRQDPQADSTDFLFVGLVLAAAWLAGYALRHRLAQASEAEERATRLEREREVQAREAVAEERARIARELHDVVGHSVSVMTVQASAVRRLLRPEQEQEREALLVVEKTGREALAEMRKLVGVLRRPEEAPALAPQPSLEHLEKLVQQVREAGLPVELRVEGEAAKLAPGVDLTAYRVVQEGLTNALKHARAKQAEVIVRYRPDQVELVVTDDGDGGGDGEGGGHGLVGMRERVTVYGGALDAGPRPDGGYELRAQLPVTGEA
jgi:signal transduction histidine kinase